MSDAWGELVTIAGSEKIADALIRHFNTAEPIRGIASRQRTSPAKLRARMNSQTKNAHHRTLARGVGEGTQPAPTRRRPCGGESEVFPWLGFRQ